MGGCELACVLARYILQSRGSGYYLCTIYKNYSTLCTPSKRATRNDSDTIITVSTIHQAS